VGFWAGAVLCRGGLQGSFVVDARRQTAAAGTARDSAARCKAGKEPMQRRGGIVCLQRRVARGRAYRGRVLVPEEPPRPDVVSHGWAP